MAAIMCGMLSASLKSAPRQYSTSTTERWLPSSLQAVKRCGNTEKGLRTNWDSSMQHEAMVTRNIGVGLETASVVEHLGTARRHRFMMLLRPDAGGGDEWRLCRVDSEWEQPFACQLRTLKNDTKQYFIVTTVGANAAPAEMILLPASPPKQSWTGTPQMVTSVAPEYTDTGEVYTAQRAVGLSHLNEWQDA